MKMIKYIIAASALVAMTASCSDDRNGVAGEGKLKLNTTLNSDLTVVSRATEDELKESAVIWIANEKGVVRSYEGVANVPSSINLVTGAYKAMAWAGDSVSASFDKRCYKGVEEFSVNAGQTSTVELNCNIANSVVSVNYESTVDEVLKDYTMTVGHKRGSLIFNGRDTRKGYFMMPSYSPDLNYELKGTLLDGSDFSFAGVITAAKPATEYRLNVKYTPKTNNEGGAVFTITVDKTEIEITNHVTLIAPPRITGYGFNIDQAIVAEAGTVGRQCVYVTSATKVQGIDLQSDLLRNIAMLDGDDCDLLSLSDAGVAALADYGINFKSSYDDSADEHIVQINFEPVLTNSLENGEYQFKITATNSRGKSNSAVLAITISDAPVMNLPVEASSITTRGAVLRGTIAKEGVEAVGFNYRAVGTSEWSSVVGTAAAGLTPGAEFTATLTNLTPDTKYEYAATGDGYVSPTVETFTTYGEPQIPNSGFETWNTSGKVYLIAADESSMFWDSGNHGSATAGSNITTPESTIKHSGNYSAKLETSSFFGVMAAGNIFTGHFLGTENLTKGILGWGRPFTGFPKAMKIWVKYRPAEVTKKGEYKGTDLNVGDPDKGIVYIALLDDSKVNYNGNEWPVIVRTKDLEGYSFKKDASNVIAYGEHILATATEGEDMLQVTIPIDVKKNGVRPSNILVVASASIYGDYYCGGTGSVLYIDDVELVY